MAGPGIVPDRHVGTLYEGKTDAGPFLRRGRLARRRALCPESDGRAEGRVSSGDINRLKENKLLHQNPGKRGWADHVDPFNLWKGKVPLVAGDYVPCSGLHTASATCGCEQFHMRQPYARVLRDHCSRACQGRHGKIRKL